MRRNVHKWEHAARSSPALHKKSLRDEFTCLISMIVAVTIGLDDESNFESALEGAVDQCSKLQKLCALLFGHL